MTTNPESQVKSPKLQSFLLWARHPSLTKDQCHAKLEQAFGLLLEADTENTCLHQWQLDATPCLKAALPYLRTDAVDPTHQLYQTACRLLGEEVEP